MLTAYLATDVGRVRKNNEDNGAIIGQNAFAVADGMGGAAAGERASAILIDTAKELIPQNFALREVITTANERVLADVAEYPALKGMGTTATLCRVGENQVEFAHVGDSRLYLLRGDNLRQITNDHSYVAELVKRGDISPQEATVHPMKNMLLRAVGATKEIEVESGFFPLEADDTLLLSTDGLTNMIGDYDIRDILIYEKGNLAQKLVDAALAAGGRDNVTALTVQYHAS